MSGTTTGIWISANSATVLQWSQQGSLLHRIVSTVPGRHRSTGRPPTDVSAGADRSASQGGHKCRIEGFSGIALRSS